MRHGERTVVTCAICLHRYPAELILDHLDDEHELDVRLATWPDGELVILDRRLEPLDFAELENGDTA